MAPLRLRRSLVQYFIDTLTTPFVLILRDGAKVPRLLRMTGKGRLAFALRDGSPVPSPVQPEEARRACPEASRRAVSKAALNLSKDRKGARRRAFPEQRHHPDRPAIRVEIERFITTIPFRPTTIRDAPMGLLRVSGIWPSGAPQGERDLAIWGSSG
jgi:hypothetical protein